MVDECDECGLESNDHTIALSRFMVRADQPKQRLALLQLLQVRGVDYRIYEGVALEFHVLWNV